MASEIQAKVFETKILSLAALVVMPIHWRAKVPVKQDYPPYLLFNSSSSRIIVKQNLIVYKILIPPVMATSYDARKEN